jgi:hypothetical protein
VNSHGSEYLLVFTLAIGASLVYATTWVSGHNVLLICLIGIAAVAGIVTVAGKCGVSRGLLLVLASMAAILTGFGASSWLWSSVLNHRGVTVDATVIEVRDGNSSSRDLRYTIAGPDGQRIPGELGWWPGAVSGAPGNPEGKPGDVVVVVVDPAGLVNPRLPEELADTQGVGLMTAALFLGTASLCMLAGRPRKVVVRKKAGSDGPPQRSRAKRMAAERAARRRADRKRRQARRNRPTRSDGSPGRRP